MPPLDCPKFTCEKGKSVSIDFFVDSLRQSGALTCTILAFPYNFSCFLLFSEPCFKINLKIFRKRC